MGWWTAQGNGTVITAINIGNATTGSVTARNVATTNLFTSTRRVGFVSGGGSNSSAGTRHNLLQYWRGNGIGLGGFFYVIRFGISSATTIATQRTFVGFIDQTAVLTNTLDPSTETNCLGFGADSADANFSFYHNDTVGSVTKELFNANFPAKTLSTDLYEGRIFCSPNNAAVYYSLENLSNGSYIEGNVTTDIPSNTTLLSIHIWTNNGSGGGACGIDVLTQYIETYN